MTIHDLSQWSKRNIWRTSSGDFCVRPGLRQVYNTLTAGRHYVGGFTIVNSYTDEVWHYLFDVADTAPLGLKLHICDDSFNVWQTFSYGIDKDPRAITKAVVEGQILICTPDTPTLFGLIGGPVYLADSVASDSGSTAIAVPRGIVTPWNNRAVICEGRSMYVTDPVSVTGGDLRSIIGENQNQRPGIIYGVHEGAGGMLVCVTSEGVYGLDSAAAAVGVVGSNGADWRVLNHNQAVSHESSCVVRGRVLGLTRGGWSYIDTETDTEASLSDAYVPRAYGTRIEEDDFRYGRMFGSDVGPIVSLPDRNAAHFVDLAGRVSSWWESVFDPDDFKVRGTLQDVGGDELLICENGIFAVDGDHDGTGALTGYVGSASGTFSGAIKTSPRQNALVRHVHVGAAVGVRLNATGNKALCAVRGAAASATPPVDANSVVLGQDIGAEDRWMTTPLAAVRFDFGQGDNGPTRDVALEVGAEGSMTRLADTVDVELSESAPVRPIKTAGT